MGRGRIARQPPGVDGGIDLIRLGGNGTLFLHQIAEAPEEALAILQLVAAREDKPHVVFALDAASGGRARARAA